MDEPECLNCRRLERDLARALDARTKAIIDIENLEVELRVKRAQNAKLAKELEVQRDEDPSLADAKAVYTYWVARLAPKARSFKNKRRKAVLDRLKDGYTLVDLLHAIDGVALGVPYPNMTELEYICRDETIVDRFRTARDLQWRKLSQAFDGPDPLDDEQPDAEALATVRAILRSRGENRDNRAA